MLTGDRSAFEENANICIVRLHRTCVQHATEVVFHVLTFAPTCTDYIQSMDLCRSS